MRMSDFLWIKIRAARAVRGNDQRIAGRTLRHAAVQK
jgi:hypothetical protein